MYGAQVRNQRTPELPHVNAFNQGRVSAPFNDPYSERANIAAAVGTFKGVHRTSQQVAFNESRAVADKSAITENVQTYESSTQSFVKAGI